jgi:hypothetical protein
MEKMKIKAHLYPNPSLQEKTPTNIWGEKYEMKNEPFLELVFCHFPSGKYLVELLSPLQLEQTFKISCPYESFFFLRPEFTNPMLSRVSVRVRKGRETVGEFVLPVPVRKITGQVRGFLGESFPAYV